MMTSMEQFVAFVRSNRTLGIVCLAGLVVIGLNFWLWRFADELAFARRAYRIPPAAPLMIVTNLGKALWGVSHILLGWALWRSRQDLAFRDGRRWPSIALATNCFTCAIASFVDVAVIFFPLFVLRAALINVAAWSTATSAVLFPIWLRQYKVEITKE